MHWFLRIPLTCSVLALLFKVFGMDAVGLFVVVVLLGYIFSRAAQS